MPKKYIEREDGKPFIWGWDDESVFFSMDGDNLYDRGIRIQDHPELRAAILALCVKFVREMKKEEPNV